MSNQIDMLFHSGDRFSPTMRVYENRDDSLSFVIVGKSGSNARFSATVEQVKTLRSLLNHFLDVEEVNLYDEAWQKGFSVGQELVHEEMDEEYLRGRADERQDLVLKWAKAAGA